MDINYNAGFLFLKSLCHMLSHFINCIGSQWEIRTLEMDYKTDTYWIRKTQKKQEEMLYTKILGQERAWCSEYCGKSF